MGDTKRMIRRGEGKHGSDEPAVLANALGNQRQSGNYRGSAEKREKRGEGTVGRVRKAVDRKREKSKIPPGK